MLINTLPPTECLLTVLCVARLGSFSEAALELTCNHATISRRVAVVEAWANTRVFERHARGARPTVQGQRFLTRLEQGLASLEKSAGSYRKPRRTIASTIRVATTAAFAQHWLLDKVALLEAECGGIRIEVGAEVRLVDPQVDLVDIAVRYGAGPWKGLVGRSLFAKEGLTPIVARSLLSRGDLAPTATAIVRLPLIHTVDSVDWHHWCQQQGIGFHSKGSDRSFSYYDLAQRAAEAGLGVALRQSPLDSSPLPSHMVAIDALQTSSPMRWQLLQRADEADGTSAASILATAMRRHAKRHKELSSHSGQAG